MICSWSSALTKGLKSNGWSGKKRANMSGSQCSSDKEGPTGIACLVGRWEWEGKDGAGRVAALGGGTEALWESSFW